MLEIAVITNILSGNVHNIKPYVSLSHVIINILSKLVYVKHIFNFYRKSQPFLKFCEPYSWLSFEKYIPNTHILLK